MKTHAKRYRLKGKHNIRHCAEKTGVLDINDCGDEHTNINLGCHLKFEEGCSGHVQDTRSAKKKRWLFFCDLQPQNLNAIRK